MALSLLQKLGVPVLRVLARLLTARVELSTEGLEHLPESGPVVLAARHYHQAYDGLVLLAAIPRPVHLVISIDWAPARLHRVALHGLAYLAAWPVLLRSERVRQAVLADAARKAVFLPEEVRPYRRICLEQCTDLLADGRIVVMFPEAYPNVDIHDTPKSGPDDFLPFRPGFVWIAQSAARRLGRAVPVVPVGFRYRRNRRWHCVMRFGEPLYVDAESATEAVVTEVQSRVQALSAVANSAVTDRRAPPSAGSPPETARADDDP